MEKRIYWIRKPKYWVGKFPSVSISYRDGELNNNDRIEIETRIEEILKPFESSVIYPNKEDDLFETLSENLKP